ncbi:MAG: PIN domain-containing protein, partial [Candidatus Limnocylindrales bacterium]
FDELDPFAVSCAEISSISKRGPLLSGRAKDPITVDLELASRAAWFKLRGGISYADCFAAALAHRDGLPLITGDPEFRRVEDVIQIAWLESFG